jgi:hypothetical protein
MKISFKEWLEKRIKNESMTSTADVASFARPLVLQDEDKKKTHLLRRIRKDK